MFPRMMKRPKVERGWDCEVVRITRRARWSRKSSCGNEGRDDEEEVEWARDTRSWGRGRARSGSFEDFYGGFVWCCCFLGGTFDFDCMMDISLCEIEVFLMAKVDCIWSSYLCTECLYDLKLETVTLCWWAQKFQGLEDFKSSIHYLCEIGV